MYLMVLRNKLSLSAAHHRASSIKVCCIILGAGLSMLEVRNKWFPRITFSQARAGLTTILRNLYCLILVCCVNELYSSRAPNQLKKYWAFFHSLAIFCICDGSSGQCFLMSSTEWRILSGAFCSTVLLSIAQMNL